MTLLCHSMTSNCYICIYLLLFTVFAYSIFIFTEKVWSWQFLTSKLLLLSKQVSDWTVGKVFGTYQKKSAYFCMLIFTDQAAETAGNIFSRRSDVAEDRSFLNPACGEERSASGHSGTKEYPSSCQTDR